VSVEICNVIGRLREREQFSALWQYEKESTLYSNGGHGAQDLQVTPTEQPATELQVTPTKQPAIDLQVTPI